MADAPISKDQREFRCIHCNGLIRIPRELPPTTGPCPHCSGIIASPALEVPELTPPQAVTPIPGAETPPPVVAPAPLAEAPPLPSPASPLPISPPPVLEVPAVPAGPPPLMSGRSEPLDTPAISAYRDAEDAKTTAPTAKLEQAAPEPPADLPAKNVEKPRRSGLILLMLVLLLLGLILLAVVNYLIQELGKNTAPPVQPPAAGATSSAVNEANYIRGGWQKDATRVLGEYMAGTTAAEKIPYILHGEALAPKIETFYGGCVINDSDTPADGFSVYELPEKDLQRGLFMMIYELPPQFDSKEFFRPLASLEVQHGLDRADLLLNSLARAADFATEPLRVLAFFKRTDNGLKLDWETFAQTKYRTFLDFIELPEADQTAIFRVHIQEDVSEKTIAVPATRSYRLFDPANRHDSVRVNVKIESEAGRLLSEINWRDGSDSEPVTPTATVELKWAGERDAPELVINKFICWEFLGLGGEQIPVTAAK